MVGSRGGAGTSAEEGKVLDGGLLAQKSHSATSHLREVTLQCGVSPAGVLHPVHAQLERFEAGPGCAAREGGAKETHVISVARPNHIILVLSSQDAMHWVLESEGLPKNLHVLVQVLVNSTLENGGVSARVHTIPSLPWRPRALLRWTLQRHATVSSLTHSTNPSMPSVCRLKSLFLSHNYMVSKLQEQEVNGCASSESLLTPEVHIIKLWSLQVEVSVSLLPPVADAGWCNVVLVLSSAAPVNWALVTPGLRGHITVHSTHSVTPLYPPKPDLTMSSTIVPDLLTTPDLLAWANHNGYPSVMSYTEAHLANRLVIKLKGGGTVQAVREAKVEETWLRHWMSHEVGDDVGSRKILLWRSKPSLNMSEKTDEKSANESTPLVIHVRCAAPLPALSSASPPSSSSRPQGMLRSGSGPGSAPGPAPGPGWLPAPHGGPLFSMRLFATDRFEQKAVGPCMVTVQGRVYAETSWSIIRDFCPVDSSFIMHTEVGTERGAGEDGDGDPESNEGEGEDSDDEERPEEGVGEREKNGEEDEAQSVPKPRDDEEDTGTRRLPSDTQRDRGLWGTRDRVSRGVEEKHRTDRKEKTVQLRFSFILRPVFNNSIQFLHCSLQLPVLVTYLPEALAGLVPPPAVTSSLLISVIAAFLMGIVLMGALWCIYTCTGRPANGPRNNLQEILTSWSPMSPVEHTTSSV
ncbi:hypothetical protein KOW79_010868 [Hemibagrus wyckioides]|uniref:TGFBR3/Endoglin-like N-terminal domain-containing protein n=1 Tax=Hemibagrus wyckioides TaxID=337641 RepID=A0A9D3NN43_9TELE|nr:hypothetical protein KOW79_010868 [Hemibagrus wyckioides]